MTRFERIVLVQGFLTVLDHLIDLEVGFMLRDFLKTKAQLEASYSIIVFV